MKPIRTIVILLAALLLAASCIDPRPAPSPRDTSSHDIEAVGQVLPFSQRYVEVTRARDTVFLDRTGGGALGKRKERENTPAFQVIPAYQPYNTSKQ